jgi:MtN3 and saliva related transmembrane protein
VVTDAVGWASSLILLLTLGKQVHKQWRERKSEGISRWLFVGQMAASIGFTVYSALVRNWVFVVTNGLLVLNGVAGYVLFKRNQRRVVASEDARPAADGPRDQHLDLSPG